MAFSWHYSRNEITPDNITIVEPPSLPVYGLDRELQVKQASKYNLHRESQAREWLQSVLNTPVTGDFGAALKDGVLLATLAAKFDRVKINRSGMPFHHMENIQAFLDVAIRLGVPKHDLFQTVDLYERKNLGAVVDALFAFARHARGVPPLGPALAKSSVSHGSWRPDSTPPLQSGHYAALKAAENGATGVSYGMRRQVTKPGIDQSSNIPSQQSGHNAALKAAENGATGVPYGMRRQVTKPGINQSSNTPSQQSGHQAALDAKSRGATLTGIRFGARREIV